MGDDIFKLLMIMLLIISDKDTNCNNSLFSTLNTLIIVSLLFKTDEISGNTTTTNTTNPVTNGIFPA